MSRISSGDERHRKLGGLLPSAVAAGQKEVVRLAILETGATGVVGAHVCQGLVRQGIRVVGLDPMPSNVWSEVLSDNQRQAVTLVTGDVGSMRDVCAAITDHRVTRIIHLASLLNPASDDNPHLAIRVNVQGHANILEVARLHRIEKIVWASSVVVSGPRSRYPEGALPNDAPHFPANHYAATKSYAEFLSSLYRNR